MDTDTCIYTLKEETSRFVMVSDWENFRNPKNLPKPPAVEASELLDLCLWDREPKRDSLED